MRLLNHILALTVLISSYPLPIGIPIGKPMATDDRQAYFNLPAAMCPR